MSVITKKNQRDAKYYSLVIAMMTMIIGMIVLLGGWAADIAIFRTVLPNLVSMKANTAFAFILAGLSLVLYHLKAPTWAANICAAIVGVIGLLTLIEVVFEQDFGIDELLFADHYTVTGHAGRMATLTCITLVFASSALLLINKVTTNGWRLANGFAFLVLTSSFISMLGYLYGISSLYKVSGSNPMAIHTAILFFWLAVSIIWSRPDVGLMKLMTADSAAGLLIRRLLPAAIFLPPILGWLRLQGQYLGLYGLEFGLALFASGNIAVFSVLTWWAARAIQQADNEKQKIKKISSWQQAILNSADLTIISTDLNGIILTCNEGALTQLGYQAHEVIGRVTPAFFHDPEEIRARAQELSQQLGRDIQATFEVFTAKTIDGVIEENEWTYVRKDGSVLSVRLSTTALHDETGQLTGFLCISRDITEKKKAIAAASASEVRFRDLFESANDLIQSTAPDGRLLYVNSAWLKALKYSRTDLSELSLGVMSIVHPNSQQCFLKMLQQVMDGKNPDSIEVVFVAKDQSEIVVEGSSSCQFVNGLPVATRSIFRDITQRKHHEQQIAQQQQQLRDTYERNQAILDYANYSIITTDENGIITTFNKGAENLLGYRAEEVVNRKTPAIIHLSEEVLERSKALSFELKTTIPVGFETFVAKARLGHADEHEWTYVCKDGRHVLVLLSVTAQRDNNGQIIGFLGIASDITERKRIENMKSEFISTVSHELRTPLTSIRGALGLVLGKASTGLSDKAKMLLETANRNCERLTLLINDILDLEKIESGSLSFHMLPVDLVAIAEKALISNEGYAQQHHITLVMTESIPQAMVMADEHRLLQVFANLLSNAIKYSASQGIVRLTVNQHQTGFRVCIKDTGSGIPESFRQRLFERFAQADSSDTRAKGGTGLGLSITKAIVERHDGRISYHSEEGVGTEFYIDLPEWMTKSATTHQPTRILICEYDLELANTLVTMLAQENIMSDLALTISAARELLEANYYRALLLDLSLSDIEGLRLIRDLRARSELVDLPIIVVSGHAQNHHESNVVDWLQKPVMPEQLLHSLKLASHTHKRPRLLHVEDDSDITQVTQALVEDITEYTYAHSVATARSLLAEHTFDMVLLDLNLPDGSGLELIDMMNHPKTQVIIFSGEEPDSIQRHRVSAVLTKSKTTNESLLATIKTIINQVPSDGESR